MGFFKFLKQVFSEFGNDKAGQMSAAFAYIAVFSIAPLLLILVSVVSLVYGQRAAEGQLYSQLSSSVGPQTAKTLQDVIAHSYSAGKGILGLIIGIVGVLLAAIGLTSQLQNSFNAILGAEPDPAGGIKRTIYFKFKNLIIIGLAGLIGLASLTASSIFNSTHVVWGLEILNTLVSIFLFWLVLYLLYRFLPDLVIPRKIALAAAVGVGVMFLIGKIVLGIVIGRNATASAYGAAASLVVILLWFYYIAQILLLGAEGIKVYAENHALSFKAKSYTLKKQTIDINMKKDLRGRLLDSFIKGYKTEKKHHH